MATAGNSCAAVTNLRALQKFHQRCGRRITLSNGNRTATRSIRDFSHALVFSSEPLVDDVLFEVVIEEKSHCWGGNIEIGVTSESPDKLDLPSGASAMRNGTWVMSGIDVRYDGTCLFEFYGTDLETLNESDCVGVMRTSNDELIFYVNGEPQGVAAKNIPKVVYGLVDLYGRCVQVSLFPRDFGGCVEQFPDLFLQHSLSRQIMQNIDVPMSVDVTVGSMPSVPPYSTGHNSTTNNSGLCSLTLNSSILGSGTTQSQPHSSVDPYDMNHRMRFHTRCGSLVKLSPNFRSAERRRPLDEFNNGVVMTHRPIKDNELFEIRIDKLVDKWSGSIEVGVTTHNPTVLHFPATMTNMRSGTIMMSGCGILTNGKGTRRQYGEFNLDELREGDRVGMMRKSNGNLHYYINGQDQGVAATRVAPTLWGVIDLYGMTIKVTIVDRDEREQQNLVTRRNNFISIHTNASDSVGGCASLQTSLHPEFSLLSPESDVHAAAAAAFCASGGQRNEDRLTFHPLCGSHATVTHSGRTALRPNAADDFNNGVVLTRRPLRPNEVFQVRLERVVTKWAGSVEMGVTTYSAEELEFPFTMTNVRSGTWMMTGNGVMHNGITVIEQYGQNLDRLQVGDRVGVVRKDDGTLHFWVNGIDQGPAASNVPERIYGVIDLYGQAAQASIVDTSECGSPDTGNSTISNTTLYSEPPLRFHNIHGKNAAVTNGGLTASRPNSLAEFNDAILFSNRPLRQRELFEVIIESMVRHWSGNIEIGITGTRPDDIQLAANATDLDNDTIILCGSMIFHNRKTIRTNMVVDLDTLNADARVGVMRNGDYIHFYIDGTDQGPACECRMANVWGVVDLYGQCAQVSLLLGQPELARAPYATSENSQSFQATSVIQPPTLDTKHRWTCISGNVALSQNWTLASRIAGALSRCLVFSEHPLTVGAPFEIKLVSHNPLFAGCLKIGITDLNLSDEHVRKSIPVSIKRIPANVWYVSSNEVRHNSKLLQHSLVSLDWLRIGDRIALELTPARMLRILLNSEDMNINFQHVPNDVYVVVELQGSTMAVQVISTQGPTSPLRPCSLRLQDSLEFGVDPLNKQDSMLESIDSEAQTYEFSELHGRNVRLLEEHRSAIRTQSYNHALVYINKPLCKGESISIKVDAVNMNWKGTIGLGVVGICPHLGNVQLPSSIVLCKRPCWVATNDYININGQKIASKYGEALEHIQQGTVITMTLSHSGILIIMAGSTNLEDLAAGLPSHVYPVFDIYGKCEGISILTGNEGMRSNGTPIVEEVSLENDLLNESEANVPQCEKADLEVHEKESEPQQQHQQQQQPQLHLYSQYHLQQPLQVQLLSQNGAAAMNRSVMESVSENLLLNISIKNRSLEQNRAETCTATTSACCLRESLQLQHNTNLNIQRSQSTQRFQQGAMNSSGSAASTTAAVSGSNNNNSNNSNNNFPVNLQQACYTNRDCNNTAELGAVGVTYDELVANAISSVFPYTVVAATGYPAATAVAGSSSLQGNSKENLLDSDEPENNEMEGATSTSADAAQRLLSRSMENNESLQLEWAAGSSTAGNNMVLMLTDVDIDTETDVDAYVEADANADVDADAEAHVDTNANASAGANTDADVDAKADADVDVDVDADADANANANINAAANTTANANASADADDFDDNALVMLMMQHLQFHHQPPLISSSSSASATAFNLELSSGCFETLPSLLSFDRTGCQYLKLVQQFCASLVLPQTFFQPLSAPICFCSTCNVNAAEKLQGWVYFKLNQQTVNAGSASATAAIDTNDWLPLYYMTRVDKIRAILDHGQPVPIESSSSEHSSSFNLKDEPGTRLELYFSPNSRYVPQTNAHHKFVMAAQTYRIGTAFEVYVRHQSLCATSAVASRKYAVCSTAVAGGSESVERRPGSNEAASQHDAATTNCAAWNVGVGVSDGGVGGGGGRGGGVGGGGLGCTSASVASALKDMTWFTKEAGACIITGLILKLEKIEMLTQGQRRGGGD